jgi:hypothetical protein|nr:MAG TPA: hypothetical protein [Caudoviricetes sp.]
MSRNYTYSYYDPFEYPDEIEATGPVGEIYARSVADALLKALDIVPVECWETLQVEGTTLYSILGSDEIFFKSSFRQKIFSLFLLGQLHLVSDKCYKVIRNL